MKQTETSKVKKLPTNVEKADNRESSEIISRDKIKHSPFEIISMEGYHFGVMGDYRITEKSNSKKEIKKQLENITWNRIIQVVMILNEVKEKLTTKTENK